MGLGIKKAKGKDYWFVRFSHNGQRFTKGLGAVGSLTRGQAELAAARYMAAVIDSTEPTPEKKKEAAPPPPPTFADILPLALHDIENTKRWKNPKSAWQWNQSLTAYALPHLGTMPIADITITDVRAALEPIWTRIPETAQRVRGRLQCVFDWAILNGYRGEPNPAIWSGRLSHLLPAKAKISTVKHHEAPTMNELRKTVRFCLSHPSPVSGLILWLTATVVRVGEAVNMRRDEIKGVIWTVPEERMKSTAAGILRVPLSTLADRALLMGNPTGVVFANRTGVALNRESPRLKLREIVGRAVTIHGIRSTFRDWCAREQVPDAVAEKCLSHVWGNAVTAAYYRDDLIDQRRQVLQRWADALMAEPTGDEGGED